MQIYIHRDGQQFGPYSVEQAKEYLAAGSLQANDLAWHEGAADWVPLVQIEGIAPQVAAAPVQTAERSWIPPKRTGNSSSVAAVATQIPGSTTINTAPIASVEAASTVTSVKTSRSSRKYSSSKNPITQRQRSIGARNMGLGALWFVGGSAITFFTYEAAAESPGGGSYFVTWGAIIFGGIQFLKGLIQYCQA